VELGSQDKETFEQAEKRFEDLDEAARRRAAQRVLAGAPAQVALADASVQMQLTRVYNAGGA
jgi:hypothetical protein